MKSLSKKIGSAAIGTLLVLSLTQGSFAKSKKEVGCKDAAKECKVERGKKFDKVDKVIEKLELSKSQEKQIKEQRQNHRTKMRTLRKQLRIKRMELSLQLDEPKSDMNKINKTASEIKELTSKMVDERINDVLGLKKVLTPEQYQKLCNFKESKKMHKGFGKKRIQNKK